jgi:hypothetical protein
MDKWYTSHTSQPMAKRLRQVQLDEQSNPLFDSKPLSPTTIRKYSRQIAPAAEKGGVKIVKIRDAEVTEPTYFGVVDDMSLWPKDFRNHTITQTQSCTSLSIF